MAHLNDQIIPKGPPDLCFDSYGFVQDVFSVDKFLQDNGNKATLETMRDDLGLYLKVLRSAMIDLINKDYADFVNLSSNLIGLDKAINNIQMPLGQLKEELLQVRQSLDEAMNDVNALLQRRRELRDQKRALRSLNRVQTSLKKLKVLLTPVENHEALDMPTLERAGAEYNQLLFHVSRCKADLTPDDLAAFEKVGHLLTRCVDNLFLEALMMGERGKALLAKSLTLYSLLDKEETAENLFRRNIVATTMESVINEEYLRSLPQGLQGLYSKILSFIDSDMVHLLEVSTASETALSSKGYNFFIRSFWSEVAQRLEINLTSIYAAGDPDSFYAKYTETMDFIKELSVRCKNPKELYSQDNFRNFLEKWNLAVYFQIRFQEVVKSIEAAFLSEEWKSRSNLWKLHATEMVWQNLNRCWEPGIYLPPIAYKFWKLSLQIISRYKTWSQQAVKKKLYPKQHLHFLVSLHWDIDTFIKKLPSFESMVFDKVSSISPTMKSQLHESVDVGIQELQSELEVINSGIITSLVGECTVFLRQVSDIPRLFRRTNREAPTKACTYITHLLDITLEFFERHKDHPQIKSWLQSLFSDLTAQYYSYVADVLTSVQKTEESLRRLKKARDRSSSIIPPNDKRAGDDDKIRLQLLLDVQAYSAGVEKLVIDKDKVARLPDLMLLVDANKKCIALNQDS